jgi:hypothetical protein
MRHPPPVQPGPFCWLASGIQITTDLVRQVADRVYARCAS